MQFRFREHWREIRRGRPGTRFQTRYERSREQQQKRGPARKIAVIAAAVVCLLIAIVLSVIPGPAFVFYILAGALLGTESRAVARSMDWAEVTVRRIATWALRRWRKMPGAGRIGLIVLAAAGGVGAAFLAYRIVAG